MARVRYPAAYAGAALGEWAARLRSLPEMADKAAPQVAKLVKSQIDAAISSGQSVAGTAHAPLKQGGGKALQGAQHDVKVTSTGRKIKIKLSGGLVFSEFGTGHQVARPILDWGAARLKLGTAIAKGLLEMGADWLARPGNHRTWK